MTPKQSDSLSKVLSLSTGIFLAISGIIVLKQKAFIAILGGPILILGIILIVASLIINSSGRK